VSHEQAIPLARRSASAAGTADVDGQTAAQGATPAGVGSRRPGIGAGIRAHVRSTLSGYRLRLLGWFIALLGLGTAATVLAVGEVVLQGIDERIQVELAQEAEELAQLAGGNDPSTGRPFGTDVERIFDVFLDRNIPSRFEAVVTFIGPDVYRRSTPRLPYRLDADPAFVALVAGTERPANGRFASPVGAVDYLTVPVRVEGVQRGVFTVAIFRDLERAEQANVVPAAASVGVVFVLIGSALAWRLADRVLAPVRRTTLTARSISESDLGRRVAVEGDDEVAELARTFNEMLDRISSAFEGQRRFMDDAGHELRTPLTIVRGHLELLEESPSAEERERTLGLVLDEIDRMTRLVGHLVTLAAAIRPDFVRRADIPAEDLVASVLEKARVLDAREWRLEIAGTGTITCDRDRITQAMLQLVENAIRYTTPTDTIAVGCDVENGAARLWVRDSGAGIAVEDQEAIFQRFYRGEQPPKWRGTGLGLSIVQAIAEAHGGVVELESRPGAGARFTIVLPAAARGAGSRSSRHP
jgi:signal transduction histidine kinase